MALRLYLTLLVHLAVCVTFTHQWHECDPAKCPTPQCDFPKEPKMGTCCAYCPDDRCQWGNTGQICTEKGDLACRQKGTRCVLQYDPLVVPDTVGMCCYKTDQCKMGNNGQMCKGKDDLLCPQGTVCMLLQNPLVVVDAEGICCYENGEPTQ